MTTKRICAIYRSKKKEGMFLFVDKKEALARVPDELLKMFGKPEFSMTMLLHPERKLVRADINKVMADIEQQGYYLQMPPQADAYMKALHEKNSKMGL